MSTSDASGPRGEQTGTYKIVTMCNHEENEVLQAMFTFAHLLYLFIRFSKDSSGTCSCVTKINVNYYFTSARANDA